MYKQEDYEVVKLHLKTLDQEILDDPEEYNCFNYVDTKRFFKNLDENTCPLTQFQKWIKEELDIDLNEEFTNYVITQETYQELKKQVEMWAEVFHLSFYSERKKQQAIAYHMLNYSPNHFDKTPKWAEEGRLYKKKV
jgi:hypothetical protein